MKAFPPWWRWESSAREILPSFSITTSSPIVAGFWFGMERTARLLRSRPISRLHPFPCSGRCIGGPVAFCLFRSCRSRLVDMVLPQASHENPSDFLAGNFGKCFAVFVLSAGPVLCRRVVFLHGARSPLYPLERLMARGVGNGRPWRLSFRHQLLGLCCIGAVFVGGLVFLASQGDCLDSPEPTRHRPSTGRRYSMDRIDLESLRNRIRGICRSKLSLGSRRFVLLESPGSQRRGIFGRSPSPCRVFFGLENQGSTFVPNACGAVPLCWFREPCLSTNSLEHLSCRCALSCAGHSLGHCDRNPRHHPRFSRISNFRNWPCSVGLPNKSSQRRSPSSKWNPQQHRGIHEGAFCPEPRALYSCCRLDKQKCKVRRIRGRFPRLHGLSLDVSKPASHLCLAIKTRRRIPLWKCA